MKKIRDDLTPSHQEALAEVRQVVAEAKELSQAADGALTDHLATWTTGRYAIAARRLAAESRNGEVDWNLLRALCHDLVDLRRGDHSAESLRIERERLEMERAEEHKGKICERHELTPEEKHAGICQILGIDPEESRRRQERNEAIEDNTTESSGDGYSI